MCAACACVHVRACTHVLLCCVYASTCWECQIVNIAKGTIEKGTVSREIYHKSPVNFVAWDGEGLTTSLATGCQDSVVRQLDILNGEIDHVVLHHSTVWSVACNGKGSLIAAGTENKLRIIH